ncbi:phosphatidylinositol-glycan biosynthesis class X protein isoform X2 [Trichomycterus rosablanca]
MKLAKKGFHRDLQYEVQHDPPSHPVKALLVHRLPRGVYMDRYQIADLNKDTGLQALLDSPVDLESPAHLSSSFSALVFLSTPGPLQATVPVHGRYHRPSNTGGWEHVTIEPPRLLLRQESCGTLDPSLSHSVVKAPCTFQNESVCSWLEIHGLQVSRVIFEIPVGDSSLTNQVCVVTLLVTMLCCIYICKALWKHGIF